MKSYLVVFNCFQHGVIFNRKVVFRTKYADLDKRIREYIEDWNKTSTILTKDRGVEQDIIILHITVEGREYGKA